MALDIKPCEVSLRAWEVFVDVDTLKNVITELVRDEVCSQLGEGRIVSINVTNPIRGLTVTVVAKTGNKPDETQAEAAE